MDGPREIELKLDCAGPDLSVLAAHPLLAGEGEPQLLVSTYYDTAEDALRAAGLTLRVRKAGEGFVQTVKSGGGAAGLFDRAEWESEVAGEGPDLAALAGTPVAAILSGVEPERRFATIVMRTLRPVRYGGSRIAATLDAGRVEAEAGDAPLCELELELESGEAGDLFALAQALAETVPLRLSVLSKSERGFRLVEGGAGRASKAGPVTVPEGADAGAVFRAVVHACLAHMRRNEDLLLAQRDAEALHQVRVALRRLRSAFSLFRPILSHDPRAAVLADELARVTRPLGRARNLDVFLSTTLPAEVERRPEEADALDALRARLEAQRARAYDAVLAVLEGPEWRGLILDLAAWIETGPWRAGEGCRQDGRDFAAEVLARLRRRIRKRGRRLAHLDPEARHRLRIAGKKLRYGAEFFAGLYPGGKARRRHAAFTAALSDLQDDLGALNDLATAAEVVAEATGEEAGEAVPGAALFTAGFVAGGEAPQTADLLKSAARARHRLIDVKPFWR